MADHRGQRLGNYRLVRPLGQGGFAEVYLSEHVFLGTYAAIKLLQVRLDDEEIESFQREARILAGLTHPNILRILDFGVEHNVPYLVMDYAPNGTLRQRYPRGNILPMSLILLYVKQIASALHYLHARKLIHRDIKPENLLLGSNNEVLLSDFGTATVFETLQNQGTLEMAGTLTYMAPEQIRGKPRPASDQYGLAIIVYEWLCGVPPFRGAFTDMYNLHMFAAPPSLRLFAPGVSSEVEEVVMTALAKDPERRFANILAFANALEQAQKYAPGAEQAWPSQATPVSTVSPVPPSPVTISWTPTSSAPLQPSAHVEDSPTIAATTPVTSGKEHIVTPVGEVRQQGISALPPTMPQQMVWNRAQPSQPPPPVVSPFVNPEQANVPAAPPPKQERHPSRRAVAFGLVGLVGLAAAGGAAFGLVSWLRGRGPVVTTTPTPTSTPPPVPGTVFITYTQHTDAVYTLAWTPKGNHIASGSHDHQVRVWDPIAPGGKDLYTFLGHSGSVNAVAWSPDGRRIASGSSDMEVLVWDAFTGNNTLSYRHHTNNIRAVAWSPDGRYIASGGDDNTVQVWDAATAAPLYTYRHHTGMIWSLAWSSGSTRIASASADKTVQVWDALTGLNTLIYHGHTSPVKAVAWSPDGSMIASGTDKPETAIQVWNAQSMQKLLTYTEHTGGIFAIAWSPGSQYIASSSWEEVRVWKPDTPNGHTLNLYARQTNAIHTIAWSPDQQRIASGSEDTTVKIWQAR